MPQAPEGLERPLPLKSRQNQTRLCRAREAHDLSHNNFRSLLRQSKMTGNLTAMGNAIAHHWGGGIVGRGVLETPADHTHKVVAQGAVGLRGSDSRGMHSEMHLCRLMSIGENRDGRECQIASPHTFRTHFPWPENPISSPEALFNNID